MTPVHRIQRWFWLDKAARETKLRVDHIRHSLYRHDAIPLAERKPTWEADRHAIHVSMFPANVAAEKAKLKLQRFNRREKVLASQRG